MPPRPRAVAIAATVSGAAPGSRVMRSVGGLHNTLGNQLGLYWFANLVSKVHVKDFWQAAAANALCNVHVLLHHGRNSHHISEGIFKSAARALRMAVEPDPRMPGIPSTKGTLGT